MFKKIFKRFKIRYPSFGDTLYSRRQLINELEKDEKILAATGGSYKPRKWWQFWRYHSKVRRNLREIVANPSPLTTLITRWVLKFLWNRIFDGIVVSGLDQVKEQTAGKAIAYIPCHRSHLDYVLLSYLLDKHSMAIPHIAAGNNLNMFFVGPLLKRGGAMFMRRRFKGDPSYSATFKAYLHYLFDNRIPIEFFIEGGRSRTGKNLSPKPGLLSMLVEYVLEHPYRDLQLVPVSIAYERVMEESSYVNELGGMPKRKETLGSLLRAYKLIWVNYGKVYVTFSEPTSLSHMMEDYLKQIESGLPADVRSASYKNLVRIIGNQIVDQINTNMRSSAVPIVATVLLAERRQGFRRSELIKRGRFLEEFFAANHPNGSHPIIGYQFGIERVIDFLFQSGSVGMVKDPHEDIYFWQFQNKLRLNIYKNIFVHYFVIPSLVASHLERGHQSQQTLLEHILYFDHLFRYEFTFPRNFDFKLAIEKNLEFFEKKELIQRSVRGYQINPDKVDLIHMLSRILLPFREALYVAVFSVSRTTIEFPISKNDLIKHMQDTALKLYLLGIIESQEANLTVTFGNILKFFTVEGYLSTMQDEDEKELLRPGAKYGSIHQLELWQEVENPYAL